ncbi:hypothetical protein A2U01_0113470, partial [Trifolium medium]|nr:hypothetical protein [Trifolium medium]
GRRLGGCFGSSKVKANASVNDVRVYQTLEMVEVCLFWIGLGNPR